MFKKRSSERFVWGLCALLVSAVAAAADEPREWLERMNEALTTRNYDGVFQHWQDGKVEQLRIIHRVKNGEVRERLVSLDGSGREFIRTGSELACYLPDKRTVIIEKRSDQNPMLGNLPKFDEASSAFYDVTEDRRTRLNRRDTRVISVKPKVSAHPTAIVPPSAKRARGVRKNSSTTASTSNSPTTPTSSTSRRTSAYSALPVTRSPA